jgi:hypothetical protein
MAASENVSELSERAQQSQQKVAAAGDQARADLEKSVEESRASAQARAARLEQSAEES